MLMLKKVIAIDPGLTGAIALFKEGDLINVFDMPFMAKTHGKGNQVNAYALAEKLAFEIDHHGFAGAQAVIERVGAMPGQGVTGVFSFGHSLGTLEGMIGAFDLPISFPTPQKWKKHFNLIGRDKDAARTIAIQLFPNFSEQLKRKKDIGRADAILIGKYAIDQLKQGKKL